MPSVARAVRAASGARPAFDGWRAHDKAALVAAAIGTGAAYASGALEPFAFVFAVLALSIAWGRGRGSALSRLMERPRLFTAVSAVYLPVFFIDLYVSGAGPVAALDRLVVFLLAAEILSGNTAMSHRPVLLGLLLLVSTAAETTEFWFALPLAGFVLAAIAAQLRTTMLEHQPAGEAPPPTMRLGPLAGVTAGSLVLGTMIFFSIPRIGAGWGRQLATQKSAAEANLETGLAESVNLGTVGKVKVRRRVAFLATLNEPSKIDAEAIYWRARPFSRWTGQGWIEDTGERLIVIKPLVGKQEWLPGESEGETPGLVAEIETRIDKAPALIAPGRPMWVKTSINTQLLASADGALTHPQGLIPRRYTVAVRPLRAPAVDTERSAHGAGTGVDPAGASGAAPAVETEAIAARNLAREYPGAGEDTHGRIGRVYLDAGTQPPEVEAWARSIARDQTDTLRIARAFVTDLSRRAYSLDTRGIDPSRPIASFLEGGPGHCEYFSSAMVIGLRLRGIPSRVVGGYLGADRATFGKQFVVREARAHMWVEAHVPGSGWTTFDPTPAEGRTPPSQWQGVLRDGWERMVLTWDALVIGFDISDQADFVVWSKELLGTLRDLFARYWQYLAALVAVCGVTLAVLLHRRRRVAAGPGAAGIPEFYRRFLAHAARRGIRPGAGETARELAARTGRLLGDPADIDLVSRTYERARFGGQPPSPAESSLVRDALARILRFSPTA